MGRGTAWLNGCKLPRIGVTPSDRGIVSFPGACVNLLASPIAVASVSFLLAAVTTMVLVPQVRRLGLALWVD